MFFEWFHVSTAGTDGTSKIYRILYMQRKKKNQGKVMTTSFSMSRFTWGIGVSKEISLMVSSSNLPVTLNERYTIG